MQTISETASLRRVLGDARRIGKTIGLVPTMGAFHQGHLALMRQAKAENDLAVVTLFVNPTQFNDREDFVRYPRDPECDMRLAESVGVDFLFTPTPNAMYPQGADTTVLVGALSEQLEGASRPGHFAGVATIVTKLLNIAQADRAYFGEKDWQQFQIVKALTRDLDIPTAIIGHPIVREPDGLALSSRNVRLTSEQRIAAVVLSQALDNAQALVAAGVREAFQIAAAMQRVIQAEPLAHLDYAVVVDADNLREIKTIENGAVALLAATFGKVRLIDNRLLVTASASVSETSSSSAASRPQRDAPK